MSSLNRELVFLILQYLDDEKLKETVHTLEKESGFFFNMRYFEEAVTNGEWDEVEKYLSGFTKVDDNRYSMKIFFEIRKQKYFEALDRGDHGKAVEILTKELKVFATFNEDLFQEITMLLTMTNFRENEKLSKYGDAKLARAVMLVELKKVIEANPHFREKLQFPSFKNSRLWTLINQSLNWQHHLCNNQRPNPDIKTLFLDHTCEQPNVAWALSPVTNPFGAHGPAQAPLTGWMANSSSVPHQTVSGGPMGLTAPSNAASITLRTRTATNNQPVETQTVDSDLVLKQSIPFGIGDEVPLIGSFDASNIGVFEINVPVTTMNEGNGSLPDMKRDIGKAKVWKVTEINEPLQLRHLRLPDNMLTGRIMRLMYTNSGGSLLALSYNALHRLWKWKMNDYNRPGKASAVIPPYLWTPSNGILMTNEICEANPEEAVPCFAISKNDSYVISTSGGKISLYNMMTFKTMITFMPPPSAATSLAFHPQDNNIIAIGMDDSTIQIYNVRVQGVNSLLKGHRKRVTGLAFSNVLNVLVSSDADSQLCVWSMNGWEKQASKFLQMPSGKTLNSLSPTRVQFDHFQKHVLAVHETQIAIYEAPKLEGLKQWFSPRDSSGAITDATFSCDSQSIYVSFEGGSIGVLIASTLSLRCMINPAAYLSSNPRIYPVVVAAHPSEPNHFALGLTDGGVHVLEPLESEGKWGTPPPAGNGAGPSMSTANTASDQPSR